MTEHTLTHLTASTAQYNERTDTRDHVDKVRIWASAGCECGNYSHAYIWIEKRTVTTIPDAEARRRGSTYSNASAATHSQPTTCT